MLIAVMQASSQMLTPQRSGRLSIPVLGRKSRADLGSILFSIVAMSSGARSYWKIYALIHAKLALLNAAFPKAALQWTSPYTLVAAFCTKSIPRNWNVFPVLC
jgi:hypothetical protein